MMVLNRAAAGVAVSLLIGAAAQAQTIVPTHAQVCVDGVVDEDRLASFLLDTQGVSRAPEDAATRDRTGELGRILSPRQRVLADEAFCNTAGRCPAADVAKLRQARMVLISLLTTQGESFENVTGTAQPATYFSDPRASLRCRRVDGQPVEAPGAQPKKVAFSIPLRVRGAAEALNVHRDDPEFKGAEAARVNFKDDHENKKKVEEFALLVGLPILLASNSRRDLELIPYGGINRSITEVEGQSASITADTHQFGVIFDGRWRTDMGTTDDPRSLTHWVTFRPDYLINDFDDSRLWTFNVVYTPVVNGFVNDYIRLNRQRDDFVSVRPIFDLRAVAGSFAETGSRTPEQSEDFARLGAQLGLALTSDNPRWPLDVVVSETWLPSLRSGDDLSYFRSKVSWALDPKRMFTIDLTYTEGRRTDISKREEGWSFGFGAKY